MLRLALLTTRNLSEYQHCVYGVVGSKQHTLGLYNNNKILTYLDLGSEGLSICDGMILVIKNDQVGLVLHIQLHIKLRQVGHTVQHLTRYHTLITARAHITQTMHQQCIHKSNRILLGAFDCAHGCLPFMHE